jgi:aminopeptidase N
MQVERIVAHEYFHNWTGNRVTCRDWFQLTLKEGLTVFRDQQFTADMHSAAVKRIGDVQLLREGQFPEDAGPMSHPIRPDSYVEINNFYTRTVYEKGAEVIRMIHTLIGPEAYRAGIDLYFQRHDGQAVTCEDFVRAMEDASGKDLRQFRRWYSQSGTPELAV